MTHEERRLALKDIDPSDYSIYGAEVKLFLQYFKDMERVKELGGLHVLGSERHEARRIDNQLRGRAARQGDPGSSRFYLSLEDDLMRLFGGDRVSGLMERLKVDDSLPLEVRLVGNIIENSQSRVEGSNFDVRKHLLEYDDVLNKQRGQIYGQRDRIFVKEDLSDDINLMLENEIQKRVVIGMDDEEGPWKLIAWLEQIQAPFMSGERLFPSFGLSLLLKELSQSESPQEQASAVQALIARAIETENAHNLLAIEEIIDRTEDALSAQVAARVDTLDAYFDGLQDMEETPRPQKMLEEIISLTGVQIKLNGPQLRMFDEDIYGAKELIKTHVNGQLTGLYASRLIATVQNRIGDSLGDKFEIASWDDAADTILEAAENVLENRRERLVGENGQIAGDIENLMPSEWNDTNKLKMLITVSQGSRTAFDQKTHRQVKQVFNRFSYIFLIAQLLDGREDAEITEEVLTHLEDAEEALILAIGQGEFNRLSANAAKVADFGEAAKRTFGEERLNETAASLSESDRETLVNAIGKYVLNEVRRQLLLGATSELWVEYLTRIEALRVSIGLEAYAQRDPLVQYKSKASEMFAQLVEDIQELVVNRAFSLQRRPVEITPVETAAQPDQSNVQPDRQSTSSKGKKRRRRRN
jgi:preprotein translocase subunit SecA